MSTIQFGIRLDKKEKQELDDNAKQIGLTAATAVKMLISQFKGFSYPVNRKEDNISDTNLPSEVEKAIVIAKAEELGLIKDSSIKVDNLDDWKKRWTEN